MSMKWTKQQEEAINAGGSDILVSAAAGSGKTAVLTERIRTMVVDRGIPLEKMLVVTFTNAAASEMREKIINALRSEEERLGNDRTEEGIRKKKFVRAQIRGASSAEICTFHRFAMDVIRRYFFLTDVDPHFGLCDENYQTILRNRCLDDMFEEKFEKGDADFLKFAESYGSLKGEGRIREMILQTYDFIMNMAEPFEWLHGHTALLDCTMEEFVRSPAYKACRRDAAKDIKRALDLSEQLVSAVAEIPELNVDKDGKGTIYTKIAGNCDMIRELYNGLDGISDEELRDALTIRWNTLRAKKHEKEAYDRIKDYVSGQNKAVKDILKKTAERVPQLTAEESAERVRATYPYAVILEELTAEFHERFTAAKRDKNLLDFNDIEHEAYRILTNAEHPEAAQELRERFEAIFIDEYQDSSRVQEAIIGSVSRGDNVYMVGDVKQSIYKFRQADPDLFIDKYNGFREGTMPGRRIDLSRNFRSKGGIIDAVNGVFRNIMTREQSGIAYDDAAELVQGSSYEKGGPLDYGASLHLIDADAKNENEGETDIIDAEIAELSRAELEGELIARLVEERIGRMIYDDKAAAERRIGYGDIAVLVRSGNNMNTYASVLSRRGIPVFAQGGAGLYQTPEISVFMDLLKVIDNRRRDRELISVLYSSMEGFGFSVSELASVRLFSKKGSYSDAFFGLASSGEDSVLARRCARVAEMLDGWRAGAGYVPLPDFIWKLMLETGYYDYVSALPGGERRAANLRLFVDTAGQFTREQGEGLFSFIKFEEQLEQSTRTAQASYAGDVSDMVQIMTIHRSKGLEFPVVIIPDLSARIRHDSDRTGLQMHKNLGMALERIDNERHISYKDLTYSSIVNVKKQEDLEEEKRILYVAMTRARDELVMTAAGRGVMKSIERLENSRGMILQSPDNRLEWVLFNAEEAGIRVSVHTAAELSEDVKKDEASAARIMEEVRDGFPDFADEHGYADIIQQRFSYVYPHLREVASKSKYSVTELNRALMGGSTGPAQYISAAAADGGEDEEPDAALEKYGDEASDTAQVPEPAASGTGEYPVPVFLSGEKKITPALRGTATHKVLELINYSTENDEKAVREFCDSLAARNILSQEEADSVSAADVASFFASELGALACRAEKRRNEWAFTLKKNTSELAAMAADGETAARIKRELPDEILVQGIIDCCFRDEDGIVIVDFKTDRIRPSDYEDGFARFQERYRRQLAVYREVVEKEYGEPVGRTCLFMLGAGREVEIV